MTTTPEQALEMDTEVSCPNCYTPLIVAIEEYTISADQSTIKLGACAKSPEDDREPLIHSGLTDVLPERHPDAHQTVYCDGADCAGRAEMLHHCINENMQTWVEAPKGNYCLPCFNALDRAQGCDGWSGERA